MLPAAKTRSTRKLRSWLVEQVSSGKYLGLVWDDDAKTMFRIPWKHAGKQDFRSDEDAAIFKAWAEYKGKLPVGARQDPASWKTRLRCALNKSQEFDEVPARSQLDISEPYKVYRLIPLREQGLVGCEKKCKEKITKRQKKKRTSSSSSSSSGGDDETPHKQIKKEDVTAALSVEDILLRGDFTFSPEQPAQHISPLPGGGMKEEIQLDVRIETVPPPPPGGEDSFNVVVSYYGQEVLKQEVPGTDVRIAYHSPSPLPPTPVSLLGGFPRITLPDPATMLPQVQDLSELLPLMERGVALTSTTLGVFAKRFCQARVFWTGPHTATPGPHKIERNPEPVMLFSREVFRQQLEHFQAHGGEPPECSITLCFGEKLSSVDDPSSKLITAKITFPWAEQQVRNVQSVMNSIHIFQTMASQSQFGEITLNLVSVPL